uniref:Sulfotransferase domain-containing protein n=1 Tax=Emiliania huxleyi TaxID=2903 RepID=A0A7S3SD68_EMIHU
MSDQYHDDIMCVDGRRLPTLFIVGAQKCATSSIAKQLFARSAFSPGRPFEDQLWFSSAKEHHFFDVPERWRRGLRYYATSFPRCSEAQLTLDATPNYLSSAGAAARLAQAYGPARLARTSFVVVLCEPIRRAQSALYHFRGVMLGAFIFPLVPAEQQTPTMRHIGWPWRSFRDRVHRDVRARTFSGALYAMGRYGAQLDAWLEATGRLSVVPLPLYSRHELATLREIECRVMHRSAHGTDPPADACDASRVHEPPPGARINSNSHPPLWADIDRADAATLATSFECSNQHVHVLLETHPNVSVLPAGFGKQEWIHFLEPAYLPPPEARSRAPPWLAYGAIPLMQDVLTHLWRPSAPTPRVGRENWVLTLLLFALLLAGLTTACGCTVHVLRFRVPSRSAVLV